jgi:hypothetical protein
VGDLTLRFSLPAQPPLYYKLACMCAQLRIIGNRRNGFSERNVQVAQEALQRSIHEYYAAHRVYMVTCTRMIDDMPLGPFREYASRELAPDFMHASIHAQQEVEVIAHKWSTFRRCAQSCSDAVTTVEDADRTEDAQQEVKKLLEDVDGVSATLITLKEAAHELGVNQAHLLTSRRAFSAHLRFQRLYEDLRTDLFEIFSGVSARFTPELMRVARAHLSEAIEAERTLDTAAVLEEARVYAREFERPMRFVAPRLPATPHVKLWRGGLKRKRKEPPPMIVCLIACLSKY